MRLKIIGWTKLLNTNKPIKQFLINVPGRIQSPKRVMQCGSVVADEVARAQTTSIILVQRAWWIPIVLRKWLTYSFSFPYNGRSQQSIGQQIYEYVVHQI